MYLLKVTALQQHGEEKLVPSSTFLGCYNILWSPTFIIVKDEVVQLPSKIFHTLVCVFLVLEHWIIITWQHWTAVVSHIWHTSTNCKYLGRLPFMYTVRFLLPIALSKPIAGPIARYLGCTYIEMFLTGTAF